jgi:hypothetical protein
MTIRSILIKGACAIIVAFGFLASASPAGFDREHQVKTGFIYNIAKFCDWDFSHAAAGRFTVGIYRTEAYGHDLEVLSGKSIDGRTISVLRVNSEKDLARCQIVVLGDVGEDSIKHIANLCRNSGTLLVGESDNFARFGGTVGFVLKDGNVRFDVNLSTAKLDHVTLSSKLLRLAEQVYQ